MKNIIVKLIGVTAIIGMAALIAGLLFKLLLTATFVMGLGMLIRSKLKKGFRHDTITEEKNSKDSRYFSANTTSIQPIYQNAGLSKQPAIIPIQ